MVNYWNIVQSSENNKRQMKLWTGTIDTNGEKRGQLGSHRCSIKKSGRQSKNEIVWHQIG